MKPRFFPPVAVATLALIVTARPAAPAPTQMDLTPGGKQIIDAVEGRNCSTPEVPPAEVEQVEAAVRQWLKAHPYATQAAGGQI